MDTNMKEQEELSKEPPLPEWVTSEHNAEKRKRLERAVLKTRAAIKSGDELIRLLTTPIEATNDTIPLSGQKRFYMQARERPELYQDYESQKVVWEYQRKLDEILKNRFLKVAIDFVILHPVLAEILRDINTPPSQEIIKNAELLAALSKKGILNTTVSDSIFKTIFESPEFMRTKELIS